MICFPHIPGILSPIIFFPTHSLLTIWPLCYFSNMPGTLLLQVISTSLPFACNALFLDASLAFFKSLLKYYLFNKVMLVFLFAISIYTIAEFSYSQSPIFCLYSPQHLSTSIMLYIYFLYILCIYLFLTCICCLLSASLYQNINSRTGGYRFLTVFISVLYPKFLKQSLGCDRFSILFVEINRQRLTN